MHTIITKCTTSEKKNDPHRKLRELLVHAHKCRGLDVGAAVARVNVHPRQLGCLQDGGQHLRASQGRVDAFDQVEEGVHCPPRVQLYLLTAWVRAPAQPADDERNRKGKKTRRQRGRR